MKNRKWLTYTVGVLLTLVVLAAVGGAGFRIGMMQNAPYARPAFAHDFNGGPHAMLGNFKGNDGNQAMQGNFQKQGFDNHGNNQGFDRRGDDRRGGLSFFSPIFGLIRLAVVGALFWIGYKFVKNSGWRITRALASPAAVEEKKESE